MQGKNEEKKRVQPKGLRVARGVGINGPEDEGVVEQLKPMSYNDLVKHIRELVK